MELMGLMERIVGMEKRLMQPEKLGILFSEDFPSFHLK